MSPSVSSEISGSEISVFAVGGCNAFVPGGVRLALGYARRCLPPGHGPAFCDLSYSPSLSHLLVCTMSISSALGSVRFYSMSVSSALGSVRFYRASRLTCYEGCQDVVNRV